MFGRAVIRHRQNRDEAEKPFWISFSDLMTACMTVFLIVMAVTVVTMKDEIARIEKLTAITRARQTEIQQFAERLRVASERKYPNVTVDIIKDTVKVDFGADVNFMSGSSEITDAGSRFLRGYLPILLDAADSPLGRKWLKRVVVEGFTDTDGSYLFNLILSLERSRKVVCALFAPPAPGEQAMTHQELEQMRDLFLVGGYSFNSMLPSKARSRRIELKLEFWQAGEKALFEKRPKPNLSDKPFGHC